MILLKKNLQQIKNFKKTKKTKTKTKQNEKNNTINNLIICNYI